VAVISCYRPGWMLRIGGHCSRPFCPQTTGPQRTTRAISALKADQLKGASCRRSAMSFYFTHAIDATVCSPEIRRLAFNRRAR